jgi:hypothetical protein
MPVQRTEDGFPPGTILLEDRKSSFACSSAAYTNHHEGNSTQSELILSPTPTDDPDDPLVRLSDVPLSDPHSNTINRTGRNFGKQSTLGSPVHTCSSLLS